VQRGDRVVHGNGDVIGMLDHDSSSGCVGGVQRGGKVRGLPSRSIATWVRFASVTFTTFGSAGLRGVRVYF
jgi:hypothetical protein